jgi:hypothetical protein
MIAGLCHPLHAMIKAGGAGSNRPVSLYREALGLNQIHLMKG